MDVVAEKDGKRIAIEIETGKSDSLYNIRKDLEAGFDEVVVVALDKRTFNYISSISRDISEKRLRTILTNGFKDDIELPR